MPVPLFDPTSPQAPLRADIRAAVHRVLDARQFILGPEVKAFETEFAAYLGAGHAIGVANGTEAITVALRALGVGPGDEVVVPSFTFWASAEAIPPTGAHPGLLRRRPRHDVRHRRDGEGRADAARPRPSSPCTCSATSRRSPRSRRSASRSWRTRRRPPARRRPDGRPGALGTIATFSFYPSKNLGAFGDGGAITCRDADLADRVRTLRFHGSKDKK